MTAELIEADDGRILLVVQAGTPTEAIAMRLFAERSDEEVVLYSPPELLESTPEGFEAPPQTAPRLIIRSARPSHLVGVPN
jgi:hypothetical protein